MKGGGLTKKKRQKEVTIFLNLFLLLLENGFSFNESLQIMNRNNQVSLKLLTLFVESLNQGDSLINCFQKIGCTQKEVSQIQFSLIHGNFVRTLKTLVLQRKRIVQQKKELSKALSYPLLLLGMLGMLVLLIRQVILPDLLQSNFLNPNHPGIIFIQLFPYGVLFLMTSMTAMMILIKKYTKQQSPLKIALFISKIPFIGSLYSIYQTSYFTQEWGYLYQQGLENKELLACMQQLPQKTLMYQMAVSMQAHFLQGTDFSTIIKDYPFLTRELAVIIYQGELTGKLGEELIIYSQILLTQFTEKTMKLIKMIQPVLFIFLAVLIISIYASLLKPLYTNLGGMNG